MCRSAKRSVRASHLIISIIIRTKLVAETRRRRRRRFAAFVSADAAVSTSCDSIDSRPCPPHTHVVIVVTTGRRGGWVGENAFGGLFRKRRSNSRTVARRAGSGADSKKLKPLDGVAFNVARSVESFPFGNTTREKEKKTAVRTIRNARHRI